MINQGESLFDRTISGFPLSVGTSLAMESIFTPQMTPIDPDRDPPQQVDLKHYSEIWISVHTLLRNIFAAASKEAVLRASTNELYMVLHNEISVIEQLFRIEGMGRCKPIFYFLSYDSVYKGKISSYIEGRPDTSQSAAAFTAHVVQVLKMFQQRNPDVLQLGDIEFKPTHGLTSAMVLTHSPLDLGSCKHFRKLDLLESHTGKLKPRTQWNTKYYPIPQGDMSRLPWHRKLHWIFGDKVIIKPMEMKLRRQILQLAEDQHWTAVTTMPKIMQDFRLFVREPMVQKILLELPD